MGPMPLLLPLLGLLAGIAAAVFYGDCPQWIPWTVMAVGVGVLFTRFTRVGLTIVALGAGYVSYICHQPTPAPSYGKHHFEGEVLSIKEGISSGRHATVRVVKLDSCECKPFKIEIFLLSLLPEVNAGEEVAFTAKLKPMEMPQPIPDVIDFGRNARLKGSVGRAIVAPEQFQVLGPAPGVNAWMLRTNAHLRDRIYESKLNSTASVMLCAMLLGDSSAIDTETREIYSSSGLAHILALSGLHVGLIIMVISCMFWPLYVGLHNRTRLILVMLALWGYVWLTGFSPSVTRAAVMGTVYMLSRLFERESFPLNSLFLAAIIILLIQPNDLFSISFQLSFAAVGGIILFFPLLDGFDRWEQPRLWKLASYPALSISAMILTGPLAACYFNSFPIMFLLANILVVPLVPVLVGLGAFYLLMLVIGIDPAWFATIINWSADGIEWVARFTSSFSWATIDNIYWSEWFVAILIALLVGFAVSARLRKWIVAGGFAVVTISLCIAYAMHPTDYSDEEPKAYVFAEERCVNIILTSPGKCSMFTTAKLAVERVEEREKLARSLKVYLGKRAIDTITMIPHADSVRFDDVTLLNGQFKLPEGTKLLVLGNRFKPLDSIKSYSEQVDSIIIAPALNRRYVRFLENRKLKEASSPRQ